MTGGIRGWRYRSGKAGRWQPGKAEAMGWQGGVTLVELLAALIVSALVVVIASRIFLSGNQQYLARILESDRLTKVYLLKLAVQNSLRQDVTRCESGRLWIKAESKERELSEILKPRFAELQSSEFHCWEKSGSPIEFVPWQNWYQPVLVEYKLILAGRGSPDTLIGSWLK